LTDARRSKIKFMSFAANSAAQSDLRPDKREPQIVAGNWQVAIKGSPRLKTVEDRFAHEFGRSPWKRPVVEGDGRSMSNCSWGFITKVQIPALT
jgi:hypothetical protein